MVHHVVTLTTTTTTTSLHHGHPQLGSLRRHTQSGADGQADIVHSHLRLVVSVCELLDTFIITCKSVSSSVRSGTSDWPKFSFQFLSATSYSDWVSSAWTTPWVWARAWTSRATTHHLLATEPPQLLTVLQVRPRTDTLKSSKLGSITYPRIPFKNYFYRPCDHDLELKLKILFIKLLLTTLQLLLTMPQLLLTMHRLLLTVLRHRHTIPILRPVDWQYQTQAPISPPRRTTRWVEEINKSTNSSKTETLDKSWVHQPNQRRARSAQEDPGLASDGRWEDLSGGKWWDSDPSQSQDRRLSDLERSARPLSRTQCGD